MGLCSGRTETRHRHAGFPPNLPLIHRPSFPDLARSGKPLSLSDADYMWTAAVRQGSGNHVTSENREPHRPFATMRAGAGALSGTLDGQGPTATETRLSAGAVVTAAPRRTPCPLDMMPPRPPGWTTSIVSPAGLGRKPARCRAASPRPGDLNRGYGAEGRCPGPRGFPFRFARRRRVPSEGRLTAGACSIPTWAVGRRSGRRRRWEAYPAGVRRRLSCRGLRPADPVPAVGPAPVVGLRRAGGRAVSPSRVGASSCRWSAGMRGVGRSVRCVVHGSTGWGSAGRHRGGFSGNTVTAPLDRRKRKGPPWPMTSSR